MEFPKSLLKSPMLNRFAVVAFGGLLGFGYTNFIGCSTGSCPITSSPWSSAAYGALMGAFLTVGNRGSNGKKGTSQNKES